MGEFFTLRDIAQGNDLKSIFIEIPHTPAIWIAGGVVKSRSTRAKCPHCAILAPRKNVRILMSVDVGQSSCQTVLNDFSFLDRYRSKDSIAYEYEFHIN